MSHSHPTLLRPGRQTDSSLNHGPHSSLRPAANSSASSPGGSSPASTPAVITLDALLETHATAPSPTHAALEATIAERNLLTAQNAQLWKLIEKQRTGYSGMAKDLERIRAERDAYRNRLHAVGESTEGLVRREKEKAKALKPSPNASGMDASGRDSPVDPRAGMVRHQSDDHTKKNIRSESSPARRVPMSRHQSEDDARARRSAPSSRAQTAPPTAEQPRKVSPPALLIPGSTSGSAPTLAVPEPAAPLHLKTNGTPMASPATAGASPLSQFPLPPGAGLGFKAEGSTGGSNAGTNTLNLPKERAHTLSRESRVELPDEARRYIANMVDSPATSPQPQATTFEAPRMQIVAEEREGPAEPPTDPLQTVTRRGAPQPELHQNEPEAEFLDMDDEESPGGASGREDSVSLDSHVSADAPAPSSDIPMSGPEVSQPPKRKSSLLRRKNLAKTASVDAPGSASATLQQSGSETQSTYTSTAPSAHSSRTDLPQSDSDSPSYASTTGADQERSIALEGVSNLQPNFRALPLLPTDLPHTQIVVVNSSIKPNDRGKDLLSFLIAVEPGSGKAGWKIEKLYSDVLGLDHRVRTTIGKTATRKIASLPEGKMWKDHAPSRVDQRKAALEAYLTSLIILPVKSKDEVIAFLTSDILRMATQPVYQAGYKEGYLTKRGKNFGGWKTRYFVLQGPMLEYYESRGGTHLGSIAITGAQIGRQQKSSRNVSEDDNEYRHAFLVIESKKGPGGAQNRHVLCAESDADRDSWVQVLVRYVMGSYTEEPAAGAGQMTSASLPKSSTSIDEEGSPVARRVPTRGMSKDNIVMGSAVPISQLAPDVNNAKLMQAAPYPDSLTTAPISVESAPNDSRSSSTTLLESQTAKRMFESSNPGGLEAPLSTSLPTSSPLDGTSTLASKRSASELGWYSDVQASRPSQSSPDPPRAPDRHANRKSYHPNLNPVKASPTTERPATPEQVPAAAAPPRSEGKVKISGPISGVAIPAGFKFGSKEPAPAELTVTPMNDRREKAKSRSFWGFGGRNNGATGSERAPVPAMATAPVFGVPIEESLSVAEIAGLPAIAFRCIEYLEEKKADQEEGIYRLSGSSAVIKGLKDRFNTEGDVDLLSSDEFWDPHAIAGLLKSFFRELPSSILTRDLHLKFLAVIDFVEPEERIVELSRLIAQLPVANYSLLRALTAHLISIVQNANVNKMTMRNVGIVFSPTLGIPAGVFSLMLGEFTRVFNVDDGEVEATPPEAEDGEATPSIDRPGGLDRRNSRRYTDAAADKLLGLAGRTLAAPDEDDDSDIEISVQYDDSGTETTETLDAPAVEPYPDTPRVQEQETSLGSKGKAASAAATRGLNISTSGEPKKRQSRMPVGLPASPRPGFHPSTFAQPSGTSPPVSPHPPR